MQYQAVQQRRVWIIEIDRHFGDALTLVLFFGTSTLR
jgi:acetoin utilization deacetylase AcuC-like enzyme